MKLKKIIALVIALGLVGIAGGATYLVVVTSNLPNIITVKDYEPLVVSQVYDRNGKKIGEFFREKRILVPYEKIPKHLVQAFVSAEDDSFFEHGGINYQAILRALLANIKAGRKVQGGSTITQQVARSLLLSREKTYTRKIKEVILSYRMEKNLTKEEILWLYLNQIYLGQGAYGVEAASQIYFRKPLSEITIAEAALLAGLPQAPSRYSPIYNPSSAKNRQRYVLKRMTEVGYITEEVATAEMEKPLNIYVREDYQELAPFYLETIRQLLIKHIGEVQVLDKGIKVHTSLDLEKQLEAKRQIDVGLRELDKRQGYRGPLKNLQDPEEVAKILLETRNELMDKISPLRQLQPDGTLPDKGPLNLTGKNENGEPLPNVPNYIRIDDTVTGVVTDVNDGWGLVTVRFAESRGLIDIESMEWARKPNPEVKGDWDKISKPSQALAKGDVIQVRLIGKKFLSSRLSTVLRDRKTKLGKKYEEPQDLPKFHEFAALELEQEPQTEAALVSIDQKNTDIIAMVGGRDYSQSQFNRAYQAARQTGSSFKSLVFAAALDKGYTPSTPIIDAPIVFEEENKDNNEDSEGQEDQQETKRWKPMNHSRKFAGDILFRNALIRSLNVPTVKIIEKIGVDWVANYARRLGIFSPLNMDFTLALGSSGVTLYEMVKVFSQFGRLGKRIRPMIIHKVESAEGEVLLEKLSLDDRFEQELTTIDEEFEQKRASYLAFKKAHPEISDSQLTTEENPENVNQEAQPSAEVGETAGMKKDEFLKEPPLYFEDPDQLIKPTTAYIITSLLQGVVEEPRGTGQRARALGRPVAAKTGSTSGYYDAWFVGYTADIATGVWVGYDQEKTMGRGEVGGKAALPIWLEYMKFAHEGLPIRNFDIPEGIVFANIDNESGKLASAQSEQVVRQAFTEGTEPTQFSSETDSQDEKDFYKEELSE